MHQNDPIMHDILSEGGPHLLALIVTQGKAKVYHQILVRL